MANNDVIKIGLTSDVQGYIKEIKKELSSVKDWGLADALKSEIDDINKMLDGLSKSFSDGMNSKLNTKTFAGFEKEVSSKMKNLDDRVGTLETTMKSLVETMGLADKSNFQSFLASLRSGFSNVNSVAQATVDTMKELTTIGSKNGTGVQFVDNKDIASLEKEKELLNEIIAIANNDKISGAKNLNKNTVLAATQITEAAKKLKQAQNDLDEFNKSKSKDSTKLAELQKEVAMRTTVLSNYVSQVKDGFFKKDNPITSELKKQLNEAEKEFFQFAKNAQSRLKALKSTKEDVLSSDGTTNSDGLKNITDIKIPVRTDITKEDFWPSVKRIIEYTQKKADTEPIELSFVLNSKMSSKNTNALLKEWQSKIGQIDDEQLRTEFDDLFSKLNKDIGKGIKLDIESDFNKEKKNIKEGISEIQEMLGGKISVFPQFKISERQTKKLQTELNKASKALVLPLNHFDINEDAKNALSKTIKESSALRSVVDNLSAKLDSVDANTLPSISKTLNDIFEIVGRIETPVNQITDAIKELVMAMQQLFGATTTVNLEGMFSEMKNSVANIHGKLNAIPGKKNPLVGQLEEIIVAYQRYQKLGGDKLLSDLGGDTNVQKWLKKHENDDYSKISSDIVEKYAQGIAKVVPKVEQVSSELAETPKETVEEILPQTSTVMEALGEELGTQITEGILKQKTKVKNALKSLVQDGILDLADLSSDNSILSSISGEVYEELIAKINSKANLSKYKMKAHIPTAKESEANKERWAESLSEVGLNPGYARLDFSALRNLTDIKELKSAYQELNKVFAKVNKEIASDRGSKDLREFVTKISNVISELDKKIEEAEKQATISSRKYISKKKGSSYYKPSENDPESILSFENWKNLNRLKNPEKKATREQILKLLQEYVQTSDTELLNSIKEVVSSSTFSKGMKESLIRSMDTELAKATKNQDKEVENAAEELGSKYVSGIEESKPEAKKAAEDLTTTAIDTIAETQDSSSPSKVTTKLGEYFGDGYINGILNTKAKIKNAVRALVEEGILTLKDLQNDKQNGKGVSDAISEITSGKGLTRGAKAYQKQIQEIETEVKSFLGVVDMQKGSKVYNGIDNIEQKLLEFTNAIRRGSLDAQTALEQLFDSSSFGKSGLANELSSIGLGSQTLNFDKMLGAENPKQLIKYYEKLLEYSNKLWDSINANGGSSELKGYADKVGLALDSIWEKLENKGYLNTIEEGWISLNEKISITENAISNVSNVLNTSKKEADDFASAIERAEKSSLGFFEQQKARKGAFGLKGAIRNKTGVHETLTDEVIDIKETVEEVNKSKQEVAKPISLDNIFEMTNAIKAAENTTLDFLSSLKSQRGVLNNALKNVNFNNISRSNVDSAEKLSEVFESTNESAIQADKFAEAIAKAENSSYGYLENLRMAIKAQESAMRYGLKEAIKNKTYSNFYPNESINSSHLSALAPLNNNTSLKNIWDDFIVDAGKAYDEVKLVNSEIANIDFKNVNIGSSFAGVLKSQIGDASDDVNSYVQTLFNVVDRNIVHRLVKEGDSIVPREFETYSINYQKLENELVKSDTKIIELSHKITNAVEEEAEPLKANLEILKEQRSVYQALLDEITDSDFYAYDESSRNAFNQRRYQNRTVLDNQFKSEDAKKAINNAEQVAQAYHKIDKAIEKANVSAMESARNGLLTLGNDRFKKEFVPEISDRISELTAEFQRLIALGQSGEIIPIADLERAKLELRNLKNEVGDVNNYFAESKNVSNLYTKIANFMSNNTAMSREFKAELKDIMAILKSGQPIIESTFKGLETRFNNISGQVRELGQTGNSLFTAFKKQLKSANAQFLTTYFSLQDWIRYIRQAVSTVQELDYALIDLRKTTSMSSSELNEFYFDANETARELGVTTKQIIEQASAWSRLGYSSKEAATEMAALSSQFKQISPGMDLDNATDGLVSTMKAFHIDVADAEREIMDVINKTGNTMATTNDEIVEMLKRSSAAMSAANNSLKETIALESAAVQITRNAETTGTAFRTISMRIRGYDEETEEYIGGIEELTGKIADLTKTAKTPGGITLFTDETKTEYKSTYEILKDISAIYHDLTDKNQAELLETLAGKRGGQVLAGILDDFSEVERAMQNMEESAGSADAEMAIVEESIDYKLNRLKETWTGIVQELIDRGYLGQIIDFLTKASELIGEVITNIGPIPTILGAIGLTKLIPNLDSTFNVIKKLNGESSTIIDKVSNVPEVIGDVVEEVEGVTGTIETVQGVVGNIPGTITSIQGALTTLMANPITPWVIGITVAVGAAVVAWDHFHISVKEATETLKDYDSKYSKATDDIKSHEKVIADLSDSYFELAESVDLVSGKNISLSTTDYEKFVSTNQQLADAFPQLIKGVDEYGNYILDLGDNADISRQKLKDLLEQEKENYNYELYKDLPDVSKNSEVLISDAKRQIDSAKADLETYNLMLDSMNKISTLSDNMLVFSSNADNQQAVDYIYNFVRSYQEMVDTISLTDIDMASNLRNALKDESVGDEIKKVVHLDNLSAEEKAAITSYFSEYSEEIIHSYKANIAEATAELKEGQSQLSSVWVGFKKNIIGGIDFLSEDDRVTETLTQFVNALPSEFAEELDQVDIQNLIADWVADFEQLDDATKLKFTKLFDPELTPEEKIQLYDDLKANLPEEFDIPIHLVFDESQELIDRVKYSKSRLSKFVNSFGIEEINPNTVRQIDDFFNEMQIDTKEEYEEWLRVTAGIDDATEAMDAYRKSKEKAVAISENIFDVAKFNEQDNDLEELQSLYNSFRENVEGDSIKVPLDISDVEGLREKWEQIVGKEAFDEFELKVTTDNASVQDVQNAFDSIVTAYVRDQIKIQDATKETMDMVKSQLKMDGLEAEGVDKFVDAVVAEDKMNAFISTLDKAQDAEGRMADGAVDAAADIFEEARALGITEDVLREYLVQAALAGNVVLGGDTSWLDELAAKLDIDIAKLKELLGLAGQGSGYVVNAAGSYTSVPTEAARFIKNQKLWRKEEELNEKNKKLNLYPTNTTDAGKAGGDAGDAWVEAYEKELGQLDDLKSQGLISEREYLDRLKVLIDKYFKDRAKYAEKYAQEMQKYMDKMLEHYNSVISGITTLLDRKISSANKGKDAAIKALQEEQAAAEEAYQAQIDAIQEEIDAIDDLIDAKNDEIDKLNDQIDAINEANAARDRSINLQKAEYELQRQMNQRTKLVYTGEQGQMRYERDEQGVRDAQENLKDAQDDIAIAAIEKQIKLIEDEIKALEKEKEALSKQQEELQKMMEASSKYYEKLIEEQEKYWDSIIEALENTKSKWEELAEVDSVAKAWGLVEDEMKRLGYTVDDVLNDVPGAFEAFKGEYIKILEQMHSGDQGYLDGLKNTVGQVPGEYQKIATAASETEAPIQKLGDSAGTAAGKVSSFGSSAGTAATSVGQLKDNSDGIADNLNALNDVNLETLVSGPLTEFENELTKLKNLINGDDSIMSAINTVNGLNLDTLHQSFVELSNAVKGVIADLGGGGADEEQTYGAAGKSGKNGMPSTGIPQDAVSGGTGEGLVGAINAVKEATDTAIGTSAEEEGENAIGSFVALKQAVDNVLQLIGLGEGADSETQTDVVGAEGTLTAAITSIKPTTEAALMGEGGAVEMFYQLEEAINACLTVAQSLLTTISQLSSNSLPSLNGAQFNSYSLFHAATGTAIGGQHYEGTAKLTGDWGVRQSGTSLVGELGQELVVDSKTGTFRTVGDRGLNEPLHMVTYVIKLFNCWEVLRDD